MKINLRLLFIVVVQGLSISAFSGEPGAWVGTEMTMKFYQNFVSEKNCGKSQQDYLGCVSSVMALLNSIDPQLTIETQTTANDVIGKIEFDANNLKVVRLAEKKQNPDNTSAKAIFENIQKVKSDFINKFSPAYYHYKVTNTLVIKDIVSFVQVKYKDKINENNIAGALNEYFHVARDPHSDYRLNKNMDEMTKKADESFVGLGVSFKNISSGLLIEQVIEGSGADIAGIESGDLLVDVDGKSLKELTSEGARGLLLGEAGTKITITLFRDSVQMQKDIIRKKVEQPVVSSKILNLFGKKIGYIKYTNFMYEKGCEEIEGALNDFNKAGAEGTILDVRGNGGGSVDIAACIVGLFVGPNMPVTYLEMKDGKYEGMLPIATENEKIYEKPLVVLIDAHSASASELISGAFRDHNRALIVGQPSFGKGSSQKIISQTEKMSFWGTSGLFFSPSGQTNQTVGIQPHIAVYRSPVPKDAELYSIREKDMFLFPLVPRSITVDYSTDKMDKLNVSKECVNAKDPVKAYNEALKNSVSKDLQVTTGAAAIGCF